MRLVDRDPHQPRPQRSTVPEPAERAVSLDESVLRCLLRVMRRMRHEIRDTEDWILIAPDDLFKCSHVTTLRAFYELAVGKRRVVWRPDHHRA
jgi:hypothetical protein